MKVSHATSDSLHSYRYYDTFGHPLYTITPCQAEVKFSAQKGCEQMTVTFSEVLLYGNDIQ